jgi:hypothetical protein
VGDGKQVEGRFRIVETAGEPGEHEGIYPVMFKQFPERVDCHMSFSEVDSERQAPQRRFGIAETAQEEGSVGDVFPHPVTAKEVGYECRV